MKNIFRTWVETGKQRLLTVAAGVDQMESRNLPLLFSLSKDVWAKHKWFSEKGRKWDTWVNERGRCFWCINVAKHRDEQQGTGVPLKWENRCINQVLRSFKVEDEGEHDERARQACCGQLNKSANWKQSVASSLGLWRGLLLYAVYAVICAIWFYIHGYLPITIPPFNQALLFLRKK